MTMPAATKLDLRRALRLGALPSLWLAFALMMVRDYLGDPYDPTLVGTAAYGHNDEGALLMGLGWSFTELVIIVGILRPWSYQRSWGRGIGAVALLLPWTALSVLALMHAGGVFALHALWVMFLLVGVFITTVVSLASQKINTP